MRKAEKRIPTSIIITLDTLPVLATPPVFAARRLSSSSPIWPPLKLPSANVHCMSGVADCCSTLAEAATIDGL